jgi:hypothetical protein
MYEKRFSSWEKWENRNKAEGIKYPGIYICLHSSDNFSGGKFSWSPQIIYIGMTNSISGLKGRLKQFDNTIAGKTGHGGADRVRYKHRDYKKLVSNLYVSISPFECNVKSATPQDLRAMGEVSKFEYDCFAYFVEKHEKLPEFNDKKLSPKYSLTVGRNSS